MSVPQLSSESDQVTNFAFFFAVMGDDCVSEPSSVSHLNTSWQGGKKPASPPAISQPHKANGGFGDADYIKHTLGPPLSKRSQGCIQKLWLGG